MDQELINEIAQRVQKILKESKTDMIPVEASGRHVHLSKEDVRKLFGQNYILTKKKELSQPGQYLCEERVTLIGPKGVIKNVAVLGPERSKTQVELSKTDARQLGINPPLRDSGDLDGSERVYIVTANAIIDAKESTIVAKRHIHMNNEDALRFNVKDKDIVSVKVKSERSVIFEDVVVRVSDKYNLSMHIDFDEANASGFKDGMVGEIIS